LSDFVSYTNFEEIFLFICKVLKVVQLNHLVHIVK